MSDKMRHQEGLEEARMYVAMERIKKTTIEGREKAATMMRAWLPEKQVKVMDLLYGLREERHMTVGQCAEKLKLLPKTVEKRRESAIERLRQFGCQKEIEKLAR